MERMKIFLCVTGLMVTIFLFSCTTASHYNFSLRNTLAIFLLHDGKNDYFCIPVQYIGDYQIQSFEFDNGYIEIGDYKIMLERNDISTDMFVDESSDEQGNIGLGNLNQYNIILRKYLKNNELKNIINEYDKGNTHSKFYIEYAITIDNERMEGCGLLDDFELYNGPGHDPSWFPPNLDFFKTNVLGKS
jgi:hypothetical protein